MEKRKFSLTIAFVAVFAVGFLAGYYLIGSSVKTSLLEANQLEMEELADKQYEQDSAFLDDYEVTPEKMSGFVEDNAAGYVYEEDGVLYVVEGLPEEE